MVRLAISVEGQTEERFVKDILTPHLAAFNVHAVPIIVATSRSASGQKAKGGGINFDRVTSELSKLLNSFDFVTSLYDFYGFKATLQGESADDLELRIKAALGNPDKLIPYIQLHEFEALLLSDPAVVAEYFDAPQLEAIITAAVNAAGTPEQVNNNPATAPSKRLENWTTQYADSLRRYSQGTKTLHAPQLSARLGLPTMRQACPRFQTWVTTLEQL